MSFSGLNRTNLLIALFFLIEFVFVICLCWIFRPHMEGGLVPLGADAIVHGKAIYKDFFTIVWPGSFLMLAAAYALLGTSWPVTRLMLAGTICSTSLLSYLIARKHLNHWSSLLPAALLGFIALPTWTINYYHWDGVFFLVCFVYCIERLIASRHKSLFWCFLTGTAAGATVSCYQPLLLACVAGILTELFLCWQKQATVKACLKILAAAIVPLLLLIGANFLYAVLTGGLRQFIAFTLLFPMHDYSGINKVDYGANNFFINLHLPKDPLARIISLIISFLCWCPWLVVLAAPFLAMAGVVFAAGKHRRIYELIERHQSETLWLVVGICSWMIALHRPEIQRLFWGSFILIILAFYFIGCIPRRSFWVDNAVRGFYALLVTGIVIYWALLTGLILKASVVLHTRRGDIPALQSLDIVEAVQNVTQPYEKVLVYPYDTTINYLTKTRFPSIHPWLQYRYNSTEDMLGSIDDMEKSHVKYVVWDTVYGNDTFARLGWPGYIPVPEEQLIMEHYITKHFMLLKQYGRYRLMVRK